MSAHNSAKNSFKKFSHIKFFFALLIQEFCLENPTFLKSIYNNHDSSNYITVVEQKFTLIEQLDKRLSNQTI